MFDHANAGDFERAAHEQEEWEYELHDGSARRIMSALGVTGSHEIGLAEGLAYAGAAFDVLHRLMDERGDFPQWVMVHVAQQAAAFQVAMRDTVRHASLYTENASEFIREGEGLLQAKATRAARRTPPGSVEVSLWPGGPTMGEVSANDPSATLRPLGVNPSARLSDADASVLDV